MKSLTTVRLLRLVAATIGALLAVPVLSAQATPGTALVRHAPTLGGNATVNGSVHQMLPEGVTLNGGATITGDLLVPGTPTVRLNGKPVFSGTSDLDGAATPSNYQVTLNGGSSLRFLFRRADPVALPSVSAPPPPSGSRHVTLNTAGQPVGDWSTVRNLTLNSGAGQVAVPPGTYGDFSANSGSGFTLGVAGSTQPVVYNFQRLTLNGQSRFDVVGPVIVTLAHGFNANGTLGVLGNHSWLALNLYSGGLTLNGGSALHGYVAAPSGTVTINGNARLTGGVVSDRLTVNGGGILTLVEPVSANQPPVARPLDVSTDEDTPLQITVTASDPEGAPLVFSITAAPARGTLTPLPELRTAGSESYLYVPARDYFGADSFSFIVSDGVHASPPATVGIVVHPVNDRPTASPKELVVDEDSPGSVVLSGEDVEGAPLTYAIVSPPAHGTVSLVGVVATYTPAADYSGSDSFRYVASDGSLDSEPAEVSVTITPVNDLPEPHPQSLTVREEGLLAITLTADDRDGDALTYTIVSGPSDGTLSGGNGVFSSYPVVNLPSPHLTYQPAIDFVGFDEFVFEVDDQRGGLARARVTIEVTNLNDPPEISAAPAATEEDTPVTVVLHATDRDGDPVVFTIITPPDHGVLQEVGFVSGRLELTYTPHANYAGPDSFVFKATDSFGADSLPGTVAIVVHPVNDAPVAQAQQAAAREDTAVELILTGFDVEGSTLTFIITTPPTRGTLTPRSDLQSPISQTFTYTPLADENGTDTFSFTVSDGLLTSEAVVVTIAIEPVNDAPVAHAPTGPLEFDEDESADITLTATDVDNPPSDLSSLIVTPPQHGTLVPSSAPASPGSFIFTWTPNPDFNGTDSFAFTASDGIAESAPAVVYLTIRPVNDLPVASDQSISTDRNTALDLTLAATDVDDPSGTVLSFNIVSGPLHGTLSNTAGPLPPSPVFNLPSPNFTYTPAQHYAGEDSFIFTASDGQGASAPATVRITVEATPFEPVITLTSPAQLDVPVNTTSLRIAGRVIAASTPRLRLNGTPVEVAPDGAFERVHSLLQEGANTISLVAEDAQGAQATRTFTIYRITQPPALALTHPPADRFATRSLSLMLAGTVGSSATQLFVNGSPVSGFGSGAFSHPVSLVPGDNLVTIEARDALGNTQSLRRTIILDQTPPSFGDMPSGSLVTNLSGTTLSGRVSGAVKLTVNGVEVTLGSDGTFSVSLDLPEGTNRVVFEATDAAGNSAVTTVVVVRDTIAPVVRIDAPLHDSTHAAASVQVSGTVDDREATITINGTTVQNTSGAFTATVPLAAGKTTITAQARDSAGNTGSHAVSVFQDVTAPIVAFTAPAPGAPIRQGATRVAGTVDDSTARVAINGSPAAVSGTTFEIASFPLEEGENILTAVAVDPLGNTSSPAVARVVVDRIPPAAPTLQGTPAYVKTDRLTLSGTAEAGATIAISGGLAPVSVKADAAGAFSAVVLLHANKASDLLLRAIDTAGNEGEALIRRIVSDTLAPIITITRPAAGTSFPTASVEVVGSVADANLPATLTVHGQSVALTPDGRFGCVLDLPDGAGQAIVIRVVDRAGNEAQTSRVVNVSRTPEDTTPPSITVLAPAYDAVVPALEVAVTALVSDDAALGTVTMNGVPVTDPEGDGLYTASVTADAQGQITIVAVDAANRSTTVVHRIRVEGGLPPAPTIQAITPASPTREAEVVIYGVAQAGRRFEITGGLLGRQTGTVGADGRFTATVQLTRNTANQLEVVVIGANGLASTPATATVVHDSTGPRVAQTLPAAGATRVPTESTIQILFSEAVRPAELSGIQLRSNGTAQLFTRVVAPDGRSVTLQPSTPLVQSATVQVVVPAAVVDLAGNTLGSTYTFSFTTIDTEPPAAPVLDPLPPRTNKPVLALSGLAEPGASVSVSGGAGSSPVVAGSDGRFTLQVTLHRNAGNTLAVVATDAQGNVSTPRPVSVEHNDHPLAIVSSVPSASAEGVATDVAPRITFNKGLDAASLSGVLLVGQGAGAVSVGADGAVLSLAPATPLAAGTLYEIVIPATVTDLFGNRLGATLRIAFTTQASSDLAAPVVYSALPAGATNVPQATISGYSHPGTVLLVSGGEAPFEFPSSGTIDTTGLFTLQVPLAQNAQNTITLRARDAQGRLSAAVTALAVRHDSVAPIVGQTTPANGAADIDPQAAVFVQFSEAIQPATLSGPLPAARLFDAQNLPVSGSWILSADGRSATFHPTRVLSGGANYGLLIGTALRDLAGNALAASVTVNFTTAAVATSDLPAAPVLDPLPSYRTSAPAITLTGSAQAGARIRVFGGRAEASATVDANGRFSVSVPLVLDTRNTLAVMAESDSRLGPAATVTITQSRHTAGVRILSPQPSREYNNRSVTVAGVIDDPESIASIAVAGTPASILGRYFFRQVILDPAPGAKSITAVATLKDGSTIESSVGFSLLVEPAGVDTKAPIPRFIFPEEGDVLNGEVVAALVTVEEGVQLTDVHIDRVVAHEVVGNIFFIAARLPNQGANAITVTATDAAGLVGTSTVQVVCDSVGFTSPPTVTPLPALTADRVVTLTGTAEPGSTIVVVNGLVPVRAVVGSDGRYSVVVPLNPNATNNLRVVAVDAAGNLSPVATVDITHDDTPPVIVSTSPSDAQTGVPQTAAIEVTFSEPLHPDTVTPDGVVVMRSALGQPISRNVLLSADGKTIRIVPGYKFLRGDTITVELAATIADRHGYTVGRAHTFQFTTVLHKTTLSGVVIDPDLRPLANVKVGVLGTNLQQRTSSFGTFLLDEVPAGDQILYIDARPEAGATARPQDDDREFQYLEFLLPITRDTDNSLGRPIFMVPTDRSTATQLTQTGAPQVLTFTLPSPNSDLLSTLSFSLSFLGGSAHFADGTTRGELTVTRIAPAHIPDRLPSGAIPHFLVEVGPDGLVFDTPASLTFPNVYELPPGEEVIVFHFKYGIHDYTELGRAIVGPDGRIETAPMLAESGFVGIVPAGASYDLTRGYLQGRVVDARGQGLAGISVNAIAGSTYVVTDAAGKYSIPMPEVRLERIRTYATVSTDLGARSGESPSLVFQSEMVALSPSGVTRVSDIVVNSFFLGGNIRYADFDGAIIPVTGLAYSADGRLVSVDEQTARGVEIFVYRRLSPPGALPVYDSEPYMETLAALDRFDDTYDAAFALSFLGSLAPHSLTPSLPQNIPGPGDVLKLIAFDRKTGFYGEHDLTIPAAGSASPSSDLPSSSSLLDVFVNLELRPPQIALDMNRVFFIDGVRRRANLPHRGIAFTSDEFVEFKTTWTTPVATPLDRPELSLSGRLRVNSIAYQTDYPFTVRGGEHFRVLELREALVPDRLAILQRDTDVGIETISISRDGSFAPASLIPIKVNTTAYGLGSTIQNSDPLTPSLPQSLTPSITLHILDLAIAQDGDDLDVSGRSLPGDTIRIGGHTLTAGSDGRFASRLPGTLGAGGILVGVGNSLDTRYGEALAPLINALEATPAGLVPSRGGQGDTVTIHGQHFSPVPADNKVAFNGAVAQVTAASETQLTVTVPALASSGEVTVTVAGKRSNGVRFEFLSVGINNGSFEDGTLRAWTAEGRVRVVERWRRLLPTHRQYMAFLDTMADPRDGVASITSDAFEVPAGMQTLLFDYQVVATALLKPVSEIVELYVVTDSAEIKVGELFTEVGLDSHSQISGFERGSGFRTASLLVTPWAGTGSQIRVKFVLKGRGALPDRIPNTRRFDHNPMGLGKDPGTGLYLDNFRLTSGFVTALPGIDASLVTASTNGPSATLAGVAGAVPAGSRVFVVDAASGDVHTVDVAEDGGFTLSIPLIEEARSSAYLLSYATELEEGGGRVFSPQLKVRVSP